MYNPDNYLAQVVETISKLLSALSTWLCLYFQHCYSLTQLNVGTGYHTMDKVIDSLCPLYSFTLIFII